MDCRHHSSSTDQPVTQYSCCRRGVSRSATQGPGYQLTLRPSAGHRKLAQLRRHRLLRLLQNADQLLGHAAVGGSEEGVCGACKGGDGGVNVSTPNVLLQVHWPCTSLHAAQCCTAAFSPRQEPCHSFIAQPPPAPTRGSRAPGASNAMHIILSAVGHVVVDDQLDVLHICREERKRDAHQPTNRPMTGAGRHARGGAGLGRGTKSRGCQRPRREGGNAGEVLGWLTLEPSNMTLSCPHQTRTADWPAGRLSSPAAARCGGQCHRVEGKPWGAEGAQRQRARESSTALRHILAPFQRRSLPQQQR